MRLASCELELYMNSIEMTFPTLPVIFVKFYGVSVFLVLATTG